MKGKISFSVLVITAENLISGCFYLLKIVKYLLVGSEIVVLLFFCASSLYDLLLTLSCYQLFEINIAIVYIVIVEKKNYCGKNISFIMM